MGNRGAKTLRPWHPVCRGSTVFKLRKCINTGLRFVDIFLSLTLKYYYENI